MTIRRAHRGFSTLLLAPLVALVCLLATSAARAEGPAPSHYDGVRLAPTAHVGMGPHDVHGGVGADLSLSRWFGAEAWLSRQSVAVHQDEFRGTWSTGLAAMARVGWLTHRVVFGGGLTYTRLYDCDRACTVSTFMLDEPHQTTDLIAVQARAGYEARTKKGWLFRALLAYEFPFSGTVWNVSNDMRYREPNVRASQFMHGFTELTVGYAFRVR